MGQQQTPVQHEAHTPHEMAEHHHEAHFNDHPCPTGYHRCYVTHQGYMDCPLPDAHCYYKTEMLTVACGADDPKPQIQNYLNMAGHEHAEVSAVLDLGHSGWTVIFKIPE